MKRLASSVREKAGIYVGALTVAAVTTVGTIIITKSAERLPFVGKEPSAPKVTVWNYTGSPCGGVIVPDKTITDIGIPPPEYSSDASFGDWIAKRGSAASTSVLHLTVQGNSTTAVVINNFEVVEVKRRPAPTGVILKLPCGDPFQTQFARINLDKDPVAVDSSLPTAQEMEFGIVPAQEYAAMKFPYQVTAEKADTFALLVTTSTCDCEWSLKMNWTSDGEAGETLIRNGDKPFRTISPVRMQRFSLQSAFTDADKGAWAPYDIDRWTVP
ncbi:hypothetical protein [Acrocarpospora sp. B8E8]|uniref:hypothetical protein n=1 Tax=Acrocarpospora sp. B8E8 TaxID=3153572 RepID=UPI00325F29F0